MDVRKVGKVSEEEEMGLQSQSKLTDSLIFNIIKKIELKMQMQNKFDLSRVEFAKKMPGNFGKYFYSPLGVGYFLAVMIGMTYLRYKSRRSISFKSLIPHFVIAFTINQVERYRGIMSIDPEIKNQYRSYQQNSKEIMAEKRRRLSLKQWVMNSRVITFDKLLEMLKFKPVY